MADDIFIKQCLELASKALGDTYPNPLVGCVIIHKGKIIGEGYHRKAGEAHAEVNAINSVENKELLKDSTLYVNLEPCSHYGKTPPCTDIILKYQIPRVVIGNIDPYHEVAGRGIKILKESGVKVSYGVLQNECETLNKRFNTFHIKKRPYVILKWAQTKDLFIDIIRNSNSPCQPNWISTESSRKLVHVWRGQEQSILVGTNTVLVDNPELINREEIGKSPLRLFIDKDLKADFSKHKLLDGTHKTIVYTYCDKENINNIDFVKLNKSENLFPQILEHLYSIGIQSIIVEGGLLTHQSIIKSNLWDEARVFTGDIEFNNGVKAPVINQEPDGVFNLSTDKLEYYYNSSAQ